MPWDLPPTECVRAIRRGLAPAVDGALATGAEDLAATLAAGSPGDTGTLAASWGAEQTGPLAYEVSSDVDYVDHVTIDDSGADSVIDNISADLDRRLGELFNTAGGA